MSRFQRPPQEGITTVLNNVRYCGHQRDICLECSQDYEESTSSNFFRLPANGLPEYSARLATIRDGELRELVGKRWLEMQQVLFGEEPKPLKARDIKLPAVHVPEEVRASPETQQACLLQQFFQLQGLAAEQRYFYANHANILLDCYDTFAHAAVLYERDVAEFAGAMSRFYDVDVSGSRSKASVVNILSYFLRLEHQRSFWRILELTAEAFVTYVRNYDEALDGSVVMEEKAKSCLLECVAHLFWSLKYAQYELDNLRRMQHIEFIHKNPFPFYPCPEKEALEAGLDVHLLIMKLGIAPLHDFPLFSSLFSAFGEATEFRLQMEDVQVEIMGLIDEMSTRFRVIEVFLLAACLVATDKEIKAAILTYTFDKDAEVVTSTRDELDVLMGPGLKRVSFPTKGVSLLETLLARETNLRRANLNLFVRLPLPTSESKGLSAEMFEAFKNKYNPLYHGTIRPEFKKHERSLLPLQAVRRYQHRKDVAKKKKRTLTAQGRLQADIAEDRSVPKMMSEDTHLFWEVGDGSVEKYVPLLVREKIKTRKHSEASDSSVSDGSSQVSTPTSTSSETSKFDELLPVIRPVKEADISIRDILWRKVEGTLKWTKLVQFLTRLGCRILNLDGSKKKVVDPLTGRCTVLHRPHPGDTCRPDQRDSYRVHLEDWLHIKYAHVVPIRDMEATNDQSPVAAMEDHVQT